MDHAIELTILAAAFYFIVRELRLSTARNLDALETAYKAMAISCGISPYALDSEKYGPTGLKRTDEEKLTQESGEPRIVESPDEETLRMAEEMHEAKFGKTETHVS